MKALSVVSLLFVLCLPQTATAHQSPFAGTWQLISGEYLNDKNKIIKYSTLGITSRKVINQHHFSFVSTANGEFWAAGTGTYVFTASEYVESPQMASYPLEDGGNYTFKYELKGDMWHNARRREGVRVEYEVWQKIDNTEKVKTAQ